MIISEIFQKYIEIINIKPEIVDFGNLNNRNKNNPTNSSTKAILTSSIITIHANINAIAKNDK